MTGDEIPDSIPNPNPNHNPESNPESNRQAVERDGGGSQEKEKSSGNPRSGGGGDRAVAGGASIGEHLRVRGLRKEFRRDQNLQIHRRGHNLPWNFPQKKAAAATEAVGGKEAARKRVYVCPERRACTTTRLGRSGTLPGSRSTTAGSTGRRSGSATSARRNTPSGPTGRPTVGSAATASTSASAAPSSLGRMFYNSQGVVRATAESPTAAATVDLASSANAVNNELFVSRAYGDRARRSLRE
ncbi:uncharacterized protein LOC103718477 [Phoenix dactylifera]|uniref:Uncharacterized protein LOC103718477 n=1 Tax=Phoenix dactylifera TaxID=42345 RepID=A0A8B7CSH7_PHODC|nr:uncharacterized protein LOC103718477 [Phoenix dactylifera]